MLACRCYVPKKYVDQGNAMLMILVQQLLTCLAKKAVELKIQNSLRKKKV